MKDKNHEGYHDPTASQAVRRTDRQRSRPGRPGGHSGFLLKDAQGFKGAAKAVKR